MNCKLSVQTFGNNIKLTPLSDGTFKLDGGAMFGIVPKPLWKKRTPSDRFNRILIGLNPLLIQTGKMNILVDTGIGDKNRYSAKFNEIYSVQQPPTLPGCLHELGLTPGDINMVILTHLHFDHTGGSTIKNDSGVFVPAFPNAKYIIQKGEWDASFDSSERTAGSYFKETYLPLEEKKQAEFISGDAQITEDISVKITGGHTLNHQLVLIKSAGQTAVYWGDLIPTASHIDVPYIMGYDLYPMETAVAKKKFLAPAVAEKWLCFWEHDPKVKSGYITTDGKRYGVVAAPSAGSGSAE